MANTKRFAPKVPRTIGKIERQLLSADQLKELFSTPQYMYNGQRNHQKNQKVKKHTIGALKGGSQQFVGAYCEELKGYFNIDGYHRAQAVIEGNAHFEPGFDVELSVFRVATEADMDQLYDQYNSALSAKKSGCYFESGLHKAGLLDRIGSAWVLGHGKNTAVQYAADMKGTLQTRDATVKMAKGLVICNDMNLQVTKHVTSGVKGALIAIAQYSPSLALTKAFLHSVNDSEYEPAKPTHAQSTILAYRNNLLLNKFGGGGGGAGATTLKFSHALGAFTSFAYRSRGSRAMTDTPLSVAEFIVFMKKLRARKAA